MPTIFMGQKSMIQSRIKRSLVVEVSNQNDDLV